MAIDFFDSHIAPAAYEEVMACLKSGRLSEGKRVKRFEESLTDTLGFVNPVCVNSGTSALHLALVVANVGPGDEVIIPAQTFIATGLAVLMQKANVVFADCDPTTGNIDPADVARRVTERTRAIIPVHWAGLPCDMDELNAIAAEHDLAMIEDAAHALGATYKGKAVGSLSRMTCFSFQAIKHLTVGDGGALCCERDAEHVRARTLRWFGINRANSPTTELGERDYDLTEVGYKYHMNDLAAALGIGNLTNFLDRLARRRAIAATYREALADTPGIRLLAAPVDRESAHWLFTFRCDNRLQLIRALKSRGVPCTVVHNRIDDNTVFGGVRDDLPGQVIFDAEQLAIPVHEGLSDDDVTHIIGAIQAGW